MRLLQFTTVKLTICLIFGILTGYYLRPSLPISFFLAVASLILLGVVFVYYRKLPVSLFAIFAGLLTIAIGILSITLNDSRNLDRHYSQHNLDKDRIYTLKIREVLKPNSFSDRYVAHVNGMDSLTVSGKILLNIAVDSSKGPLMVDDEIMAFTTLYPIAPPLNPHQFDYRKYLSHIGIGHQAKLKREDCYLQPKASTTIIGIAHNIREHIIENLKKEDFGTEEMGVIQALLLGQRNEITSEIEVDYKEAGAYHILALSGLHIGILLGLFHLLLKPVEILPKGRTIKLIVIVLLLWAFALLAGLSSSILRATTMFTFVAYALYLNRPTSHFNILALSLFFILLLLNPLLLFQVGFQLSYAAVFAIVWIYPLLQKLWIPQYWIFRRGWELVSVSMAAQLGVFPLSLFYFHQFPGLFLVSSLLILPFLSFVLGFGIVIIALSLTNQLPSLLVGMYDSLIGGMNWIIGLLAQQENFLFKHITFDGIHLMLTYGIIITMATVFIKATYKRVMVFLTFILCFQTYVFGRGYLAQQEESLVIGHIARNSAIIHQTGQKLTVYSTNPKATTRLINDYTNAHNILATEHRPLKNSYLIKGKRMVVLDSGSMALPSNHPVSTLVLTQSPKINLERLLDSMAPTMVIADGSNYKSYILRWKSTCHKKKLPFHYTGEHGAFLYSWK